MKSRGIIWAVVLVGVAALIAWIATKTYWDDVAIPTPLRGEAVTNPFYAAQRFAEALGAQTEWRQTLGAMPDTDAVIVLAHWHWDLIETRRTQLEEWVEAGGSIVLDSTLIGVDDGLEAWADIWRSYPGDAESEDANVEDEGDEETSDTESEVDASLIPGTSVPQCTELKAVDTQGNTLENSRLLNVCKVDAMSYLDTSRDIVWGLANKQLQAVRVNVGRGSVTVVNAEPFGNRDLTEIDHGELFVAATQLHPGQRIIFMSEREHTSLLGLIWQNGAPVVVLGALILAALLWRGGVRFGPLAPATDPARRSLAEQIRGTGQFTLRLGGGKALHAAAVRALQEVARRRLPRYGSLPHTERVAAIAHACGIDVDTLANAINHSGARRRGEFAQTIATLETARRRLLD